MKEPVSVCKHRGILLARQNLPTVLLPPMLSLAGRLGTETLAYESGGRRRAEMFNGWTSLSAKLHTVGAIKVVRGKEAA